VDRKGLEDQIQGSNPSTPHFHDDSRKFSRSVFFYSFFVSVFKQTATEYYQLVLQTTEDIKVAKKLKKKLKISIVKPKLKKIQKKNVRLNQQQMFEYNAEADQICIVRVHHSTLSKIGISSVHPFFQVNPADLFMFQRSSGLV
jgi:hypothetical protein